MLLERSEDEAYLAAADGDAWVAYFPQGGEVVVKLQVPNQAWSIRWIDIDTGEWGPKSEVEADDLLTLAAPGQANWCVVAKRKF
ncbi:putative collagen-binding domain-containing protein [Aureliella helgolandensis]|uniref:Uncharacterized protein n=1 Tax=Aureliella helgolandensis TaxID=2527968 RepID=A0A518G058_9BACT|nr:putative collagen-binding domain-containing protein [Aureliella helgolandensis]QDV21997.1 hypothetical protein Q31a_02760 [Aureliella helgolandensis]